MINCKLLENLFVIFYHLQPSLAGGWILILSFVSFPRYVLNEVYVWGNDQFINYYYLKIWANIVKITHRSTQFQHARYLWFGEFIRLWSSNKENISPPVVCINYDWYRSLRQFYRQMTWTFNIGYIIWQTKNVVK